MDNKYNELIKRAKFYKIKQTLALKEIESVEGKLNIILPQDFKELNTHCNYEYLDYFDMYSFTTGVVNETQLLRKSLKLPHNYIILSNENSASFVFMKLKQNNESEIIWCGLQDLYNLCAGKPMEYNPTIFKSFADFFEFLLDEEEKLRAEDAED